MKTVNAILAIALRDLTKLFRDRGRILASLIFPFIFVGVLGSSLNANLSGDVGYNFLVFVFTGVLAQNLFQSTAAGIISLIEDRQTDFAQAMFVAPVSRYVIIFGKILGESLVALVQLVGVIIMGIVLRVPIDFGQLIALAPVMLLVCLFGGAFGTMVMSSMGNQRTANQIFPFLLFPQFFLAGVFAPIHNLPPILLLLSRIAPMTYAVDLFRSLYYLGKPEYSRVVLFSPTTNLLIIIIGFLIMMSIGTIMFVRNERNR